MNSSPSPYRALVGPRAVILLALLLPLAMALALPRSVAIAIPYFFLKGLSYGQTESVVTLMLAIACAAFAIIAWKSRRYALSVPLLGLSFLATFAPFIALAWISSGWA